MTWAAAAAVASVGMAGGPAGADASPSVDPRAAVARAEALPPGGIHELEALEIGGIKQWISVRGANPANPILLFIHGGPGAPVMPESWTFQRPWEDYFTVVQWDQRGAGKTFAAAGGKPDPSMSIDRMQADTEELITYLRRTYGKDKIYVMGYSWGSILGLKVAQRHPEWLYAYIGVGQVVNGRRNEAVGYAETLAEARARGNETAVRELEALAPYPGPLDDLAAVFGKVSVERKWNLALGGLNYGRTEDDNSATLALSPDYTDAEAALVGPGESISERALAADMLRVDFDPVTNFGCPVFIFAGAHDRTTPESVAAAYVARIQAPEKRLFVIHNAAHSVMQSAPGEMLVDLVQYVRPLSQTPGAGG